MLRETENTSAMTKLITPAVKMMLRIASEMSVSAYSTSTWHCGQRLFPRLGENQSLLRVSTLSRVEEWTTNLRQPSHVM